MQPEKTIIPAKISARFLYVPLALWGFFAFAACCLYFSSKTKEEYTSIFVNYLIHSGWIAGVIIGIIYLSLKRVELTTNRIVFKNAFGKQTNEYFLSEISDFRWANKPITRRNRDSQTTQLLVYIEIDFKNETSLVIWEDEIANFGEIRSWLFDYCIDNEIIFIRPLKERKKPRYRR